MDVFGGYPFLGHMDHMVLFTKESWRRYGCGQLSFPRANGLLGFWLLELEKGRSRQFSFPKVLDGTLGSGC